MNNPAVEDIYELSPLQAGMLFHCLYVPEAALYFEQVTLTVDARLDRGAFDQAWRDVVARNPILRTSFHWEGIEKPLQVVHRTVDVEIRHVDLTGHGAGRGPALDDWLREDRRRGFDLRRAPLFRIASIRSGTGRWQLVLSFHHILLDGWSLPLLFNEFTAIYEARVQGREPQLASPRPYGDYIEWLQQQELTKAEQFWRRRLAGYPGLFRLPCDRQAPAPDDPDQFSDAFLALSAETSTSLQAFCRHEQITLNTLLQAAWALVLARHSRVEDVVFGAVVSGRPPQLPGVEFMIGMFLNTIPVRIALPEEAPVSEWLRRIQADQFEARLYEYSPLVQVQEWSEVPRGTPLFDSILVFENYPRGVQRGRPGAKPAGEARAFERTNYPLCLIAGLAPELRLRLLFDRRQFSERAVLRLLRHVATALESLAASPALSVTHVSLLTQAEERTVLNWSRSRTRPREDRCLHEVFARQATRTPEAIAIIAGDARVTYRELHERSLALAAALVEAGVKPEAIVGIAAERSVAQIVALLAVLQAGAAYVPLDLTSPTERLKFLIEDAGVSLVLAAGDPPHVPAGVTVLDVADVPVSAPGHQFRSPPLPGNLAYVIYTSGSTGHPKGVMGEHRATLNRCEWMWRERPFARGEVCAVKTPLGFVDSIWEIFGPLLAGVPIALVPDEEAREPVRLLDHLARVRATRVVVVPSMLRALLECGVNIAAAAPALRQWTVSGEALPADLARRFHEAIPGARLLNLYGSSEVAADVTAFECPPSYDGASLPIGRPIDNSGAFVLDEALQLVPIGVPGELFVDGSNLARGYLHSPDMTASRFLPHPWSDQAGGRLYRTGDVVRWSEDGDLVYLGRADEQVKLRGVRIEPGEIEAILREHENVREAVVVLRQDDGREPALVMYVVPRQWPAPDAAELQTRLARRLPEIMIPKACVALRAFPLTTSGKVLRRALPPPERASPPRPDEAPRGATEERVAAIWSTVLKVDGPGRHGGFFEAGGHSLLATQLVSRLREEFQLDLPLRTIFEGQTIAAIAAAIDERRGTESPGRPQPPIARVARGRAERPAHRGAT